MLLSSLRWKIDFSHFLSHRIAENFCGNSRRYIPLESLRGKNYLISLDEIIKKYFHPRRSRVNKNLRLLFRREKVFRAEMLLMK